MPSGVDFVITIAAALAPAITLRLLVGNSQYYGIRSHGAVLRDIAAMVLFNGCEKS